MKISKKIFVLLASAMFSMSAVSAQEVTVDGVGSDRESAIRDASRNAVESVVGTFIDSRTVVSMAQLQLDEIYSKSQGYVNKVEIIEEIPSSDMYRVRAKIDVDTNPNAALIDKLTAVMRLNDPRIAVIILKDGVKPAENDDISESVLNEKLLDLNFTHVVDADQIIKLYNAEFLNSKFDDVRGVTKFSSDHAVDYLVIGKSEVDTEQIKIPNGKGGMIDSPLKNTRADLNVKIFKYETGEIIGHFHVEGSSNENTQKRAEKRALEVAANNAADKLEEKFKKLGANMMQGIQINVRTDDYNKVEQLVKDLQRIGSVQNPSIRVFDNGRGIVQFESEQTARTIVSSLKSVSSQNFIVEEITGNTISISIS